MLCNKFLDEKFIIELSLSCLCKYHQKIYFKALDGKDIYYSKMHIAILSLQNSGNILIQELTQHPTILHLQNNFNKCNFN